MQDSDKKSRKKFSIPYEIGHLIVWIGSQVFYKDFNIQGLENLPDGDTPTILVGNHQNGMMDPLMMCMASPRQLHFLTRADIFQKSSVNKVLRAINMLPIYRPHDRKVNAKLKNEETIMESVERIQNGNVISLFPEGNHNNQKFLRPLKPGVNKLVYEVLNNSDQDSELYLVPIGLNYSNYTDFRSDLFIQYGEPIAVRELFESGNYNEVQFGQKVRSEIFDRLSNTIVHVDDRDAHDLLEDNRFLTTLTYLRENKKTNTPSHFFEGNQAFISKIEEDSKKDLKSKFLEEAEPYRKLKEQAKVEEEGIEHVGNNSFNKSSFLLATILGSPFILFGLLANLLPAYFTATFVKNNIKDPHFKSSIKLAVGTFSYLFYYLIIFIALWIVFGFLWSAAAIFSMLTCGWIFLKFYDKYDLFKKTQKVVKLDSKLKEEILDKRKNLISLASQISAL